ncbi:hypothetical protein IW261DRAFT_696688 [Armillaria novae-zelandiae]|uniref:Uncharacterized protein n=1 Tax=Armillaria novae-zelandiae TaxID=153914 RepID=A0AA39NWD0_9AGAR|nr:hypothetical protein IW261DRAFT_733507 [Armillaria novae-zelandiae]KAK0473467.1 hypothetical protein IW261DRAFT_696688 [Armillaria novae-zelandiae]
MNELHPEIKYCSRVKAKCISWDVPEMARQLITVCRGNVTWSQGPIVAARRHFFHQDITTITVSTRSYVVQPSRVLMALSTSTVLPPSTIVTPKLYKSCFHAIQYSDLTFISSLPVRDRQQKNTSSSHLSQALSPSCSLSRSPSSPSHSASQLPAPCLLWRTPTASLRGSILAEVAVAPATPNWVPEENSDMNTDSSQKTLTCTCKPKKVYGGGGLSVDPPR